MQLHGEQRPVKLRRSHRLQRHKVCGSISAARSADHCCLVKYTKVKLLRKLAENEKTSGLSGAPS